MREAVKIMLRLQELEIIKEESIIIHHGGHQEKIAAIENNILSLRERLPEKWRIRYTALRRNGMAVVREFGGVCQNCRMVISLGVLNRMRKEEIDWICPNCGRYLLLNEEQTKKQG